MNAASQKKKSSALNKGKLKKTIKNVLCRPDPILWPVISEANEKIVWAMLSKYKVKIPSFTKLHWKELKLIPKEERPKPPKLQKPEGLIFGVTECCEAVQNNHCSAILIEVEVNPRLIVQPIIEACIGAKVPIVCLTHLRKLSIENFGIKTICLGVKKNNHAELTNTITELAKSVKTIQNQNLDTEKEVSETKSHKIKMSCENVNDTEITNLLLIRREKRSRVFIPASYTCTKDGTKQFIGQDFIEISEKSDKPNQDGVLFKNMMLKRIMNNPNRVKAGKKRKNKL